MSPTPKRYSTDDLLNIMARLRAPDGCPWDKEQTHESILSCLIEESYEFIDAVERRDVPNMAEELGDLLLQVVFHSQMAGEQRHFEYQDVVTCICEKLIRRHPHVFGETEAKDAAAVVVQWDAIKQKEKAELAAKAVATQGETTSGVSAQPESALGQIPRQLPALAKAQKIQSRAAKHGFDWPDYRGPLAKVHEELAEFEAELNQLEASSSLTDPTAPVTASRAMAGEHPTPEAARERLKNEFGDLLFSMVNLARRLDIDPERALSGTNQKFMRRFQTMENLILTEGQNLKGLTLEQMDAYWDRVKKAETT